MFDILIGLELPVGMLPASFRAAMAARTSFSKLVSMRPDSDVLIGGAMLELHRVGTLATALRAQLRHNLIHKRPCHH